MILKLPASKARKGPAASTLSIAEAFLTAKNLAQRMAARRRLNALIARRVREGCHESKVLAGVKAAMTRIARQKALKQAARSWIPSGTEVL
jgi:hypothetical protein